jgi:hypothetical protein
MISFSWVSFCLLKSKNAEIRKLSQIWKLSDKPRLKVCKNCFFWQWYVKEWTNCQKKYYFFLKELSELGILKSKVWIFKYITIGKKLSRNNSNLFFNFFRCRFKKITAFDQNWPVWSSININGQRYVAMSESGKSLGIDCWNINLYFKLFFRILASKKVRWPIYINRASVVAHFK